MTSNKFGTADITNINDIPGKIRIVCSACVSVMSDALGWASQNPGRVSLDEYDAVVILGCQVTDLAVYADLMMARREEKTDIPLYIGGCLGQRFDIDLPEGYQRVDVFRGNQPAHGISRFRNLVEWARPFWVSEEAWSCDAPQYGRLFRDDFFIQTGAGCHGKCEYCTIRDTRGSAFALPPETHAEELRGLNDRDCVLIVADSPTVAQVSGWCRLAIDADRAISFRNVEPDTAMFCFDPLVELAEKGLLLTFHSPVQNVNSDALKAMGRNSEATFEMMSRLLPRLLPHSTLATNIIVDYQDFPNPSRDDLRPFDIVNWNPYWDGKWNPTSAEERFHRYFPFHNQKEFAPCPK